MLNGIPARPANGEVGGAPAHLLRHDLHVQAGQVRAAELFGHARQVTLQLVVLAEHVPEHGSRLDDVLRVRQLVEFHAGRPRDLRGEAVRLLFEGLLGLRQRC